MELIDYVQNLQDTKNTKYNPKVVCRTCGGIFKEDYKMCFINLDIIDEFTLMKIDIVDSGDLPQQICQDCLQQFTNYLKFRDKCKKTQVELVKYFINKESNDEKFLENENQLKLLIKEENDDNIQEQFVFEENGPYLSEKTKISNKHKKKKILKKLKKISSSPKKLSLPKHTKKCKSKKSEKYQEDDIKIGNETNEIFDYKCEYCGKLFKFKSKYEEHVTKHTGEKPLICDKCGECFSRKNGLWKHINLHHPNAPLKCKECDRVFQSRLDLKTHNMYSHTEDGIRPVKGNKRGIKTENRLKCLQCDQTFLLPTALERHVKVHDANRRYPCSECKCSYNSSAHLKRHFSRTHTDVKYICKYCNREFRDPGVKKNHEKLHNYKEYECRKCGKIFMTEATRSSHEEQHISTYSLKCMICDTRYKVVSSLLRHIRYKHSAEEIAKVYISKKFIENGNNIQIENLSPDDVTQMLLNHFASSTSNANLTDMN